VRGAPARVTSSPFRGQGWRLDPNAIAEILSDVEAETQKVYGRASSLVAALPNPNSVGASDVLMHSDFMHSANRFGGYANEAEWGHPWNMAVVGALDVTLAALASRVAKVACVLNGATAGVYQAVVAYNNANGDMASSMITEAVRAGSTGDFSFFENL